MDDEDLYDEFGNYKGPEIEENYDDEEYYGRDNEEYDEEEEMPNLNQEPEEV